MQVGKFITIEGIEGAGKSTVMKFIKTFLTQHQINAVWTREPGGTQLAEEIRKVILHPVINEKIEPETELLLLFAARNQHIQFVIFPALQAGNWVVSDRYIDATYAYQGGGRKMDINLITLLDKNIVTNLYPDLTLLLDVSPEQGFERTKNRATGKDRIEQEKLDFFVRVREAYLQRAALNPQRIKIVNASLSLTDVENQICKILQDFLREQK